MNNFNVKKPFKILDGTESGSPKANGIKVSLASGVKTVSSEATERMLQRIPSGETVFAPAYGTPEYAAVASGAYHFVSNKAQDAAWLHDVNNQSDFNRKAAETSIKIQAQDICDCKRELRKIERMAIHSEIIRNDDGSIYFMTFDKDDSKIIGFRLMDAKILLMESFERLGSEKIFVKIKYEINGNVGECSFWNDICNREFENALLNRGITLRIAKNHKMEALSMLKTFFIQKAVRRRIPCHLGWSKVSGEWKFAYPGDLILEDGNR